MRAPRIWASGLAVASAAAGLGLATLSLSAQPQAFEQTPRHDIDLVGVACVHLAADVAIPEHPGDRTALALQEASVTLGGCPPA
jgi:hypothetical protein